MASVSLSLSIITLNVNVKLSNQKAERRKRDKKYDSTILFTKDLLKIQRQNRFSSVTIHANSKQKRGSEVILVSDKETLSKMLQEAKNNLKY